MPRLNRILGFVSVSFVLLFVAKINKVELFTAYFRTLADVEVRNSQAISHEHQDAIISDLPSTLQASPKWKTLEAFLLAPKTPDILVLQQHEAPSIQPTILPARIHEPIPQVQPRAPDTRA